MTRLFGTLSSDPNPYSLTPTIFPIIVSSPGISPASTVRGTALAELEVLQTRTSQYNPGSEIPEKNWMYRFAKRFWFNDFGVYAGHDHSQTSAPDIIKTNGIASL